MPSPVESGRPQPRGAPFVPPDPDLARRAVVTGVGAITPIGNDHPTFWRNLVAGVSGGGPITHFDATGYDVRIAAEVKDFDPATVMDRKMARRMSRFIHFGMSAGKEAVRDSGLDFSDWSPERRDRAAVAVNTSGGGQEQVTQGTHVLETRGPGQVSPFSIPALSGSMASCQLSMEYGLTGPVITQVAACASSVICFLDGLRMIQRGEADVVLAGGSEAPLLPVAFAALGNMGALSKRNDAPEKASRPFDKHRDGFLYGEGAGVVVLESAEHALKRGATIHAEVLGAAMTADAYHISAPEPTGRGACMAMTGALKDAGVAPDELDYVVAHGTSTPLNDLTETRAIKRALGSHAYKVAISSPKSMVGHLLGAAGVISALAAIGAIREGVIPPTMNLDEPDLPECDLDYVPKVARNARVDTAMINGFGFGGQNAVAVFRRFEA
jgi:3-oxoacyl-[acyl-carrier-protein] synthase II